MSPPVHTNPRECRSVSRGEPPCRGLSPPVRGSLRPRPPRSILDGSIPARAGEPCSTPTSPMRSAVYPRPCGGAQVQVVVHLADRGLSPPVRGSRHLGRGLERLQGSIPARAGEPRMRSRSGTSMTVYPRPCGGAGDTGMRHGPTDRSIPARAGEPWYWMPGMALSSVYPRPCGGALYVVYRMDAGCGLSPPVRGSLQQFDVVSQDSGSIPARAGEPP